MHSNSVFVIVVRWMRRRGGIGHVVSNHHLHGASSRRQPQNISIVRHSRGGQKPDQNSFTPVNVPSNSISNPGTCICASAPTHTSTPATATAGTPRCSCVVRATGRTRTWPGASLPSGAWHADEILSCHMSNVTPAGACWGRGAMTGRLSSECAGDPL